MKPKVKEEDEIEYMPAAENEPGKCGHQKKKHYRNVNVKKSMSHAMTFIESCGLLN